MLRDSNLSVTQVFEAASLTPAVLRYKAKVMAKHYCRAVIGKTLEHSAGEGDEEQDDDFFPRAMIVCRSRLHVVAYQLLLSAELKRLEENFSKRDSAEHERCTNLKVYAAFSGEVITSPLLGITSEDNDNGDEENKDNEEADSSGSMRPRKKRRKQECASIVTEASLNAVSLDEAHVIIVCSKLETGFDDPRLCCMYIDRHLQGSRCVQILSRLNRQHPRKRATRVVDFANQAETVREAFEEFWGETSFSPDQTWAKVQASLRADYIVSRLLEALPSHALLPESSALSEAPGPTNSVAAIVQSLEERDWCGSRSPGDRATLIHDLDRYLELTERFGFQVTNDTFLALRSFWTFLTATSHFRSIRSEICDARGILCSP